MNRLKAPLLTALTFGAIGPFVGTLAYAVWGFRLGETEPEIGLAILGAVWLLPFGYMIGLLPAAVTGLLVGGLGGRLGTPLFIGLGMLVGAAVMAVAAGLLASPPEFSEGVVNIALIGAVAGGLSGAASRALVRARSARA